MIAPVKSVSLDSQFLAASKIKRLTGKSHLAAKVKQTTNSQDILGSQVINQITNSGASINLTPWSSGRPTAEFIASTGEITGPTTSGAIKLALKKGATYKFAASYGGSYTGSKPTLSMKITDSSGKVYAASKSNSLSWVATAEDDYTITFEFIAGKGGTASLSKYKIDATQNLSAIPKTSGDKNIDAVLAGGSNWWHPEGNLASISSTAISSSIKQLSGASNTVYYGFLEGTESYLNTKDLNGFEAMDDEQKNAVHAAFDYLSSLINVTFEHDESKANIEVGTNDQTASAGYANYPLGNNINPSILMLDNSDNAQNSGTNLSTKGEYGWLTLIHELGHAMGLKHPGPYNAGGGKAPGPYLSAALDNQAMSIMSYNNPKGSKILTVSGSQTNSGYQYASSFSTTNPATYQTYDIAALQYLYGANTSTVAADTSVDDKYSDFRTIWAPQANGVALDASSTTRKNIFDLRPGGYSSVSMRLTDADKISEVRDKFSTLGFNESTAVSAANALYKSLSKPQKDSLFNGKNNLALSYGSKYSSVTGGSNTDAFYAGTYNATIDGGSGSDTVFLPGTAKNWVIAADKTVATSTSGNVISLKNIEAIAFYKATASLVHA